METILSFQPTQPFCQMKQSNMTNTWSLLTQVLSIDGDESAYKVVLLTTIGWTWLSFMFCSKICSIRGGAAMTLVFQIFCWKNSNFHGLKFVDFMSTAKSMFYYLLRLLAMGTLWIALDTVQNTCSHAGLTPIFLNPFRSHCCICCFKLHIQLKALVLSYLASQRWFVWFSQ